MKILKSERVAEAHIDRLTTFRNAVFVSGWSNTPGKMVVLLLDGVRYEAQRFFHEREDLAQLFGEAARTWGFSATFVMPSIALAFKASEGAVEIIGEEIQFCAFGMGVNAAKEQSIEYEKLVNTFFSAIHQSDEARVLEIGSRARSGVSRRSLFANSDYVGLDVVDGPNVDIVGDAHDLSQILTGKFDFVYSVSVFEHLLMPWKVAVELSKVMNPGGLVYVQTHQTWPIHDAPWDFWRFSKQSWVALFNQSTGFEVLQVAYSEPMNITSAFEMGNPATHFGDQFGYGGVTVLAKHVGKSDLSWNVSLPNLIKNNYPS